MFKINTHSFVVTSVSAQSVTSNDMAFMRCEISTYIKEIELFFVAGLVFTVTKRKLLN